MTDIVSKKTRSRMMSGIRGKDTWPEMMVRRLLHAQGFRYRLHRKDLPGKPDIVLPKYKAAIFVNGCFWHGHECSLFKWPASNAEFWENKIKANRRRDASAIEALEALGWRCLTVWECDTRRLCAEDLCRTLKEWVHKKHN
jgi:DNA mismatch endonuclease (patch repair protein)